MFDALTRTEGNFLIWIQDNLRNPVLDGFVKAFTHLGDAKSIVIIALAMLLIPGSMLYLNSRKEAAKRMSKEQEERLRYLFRLACMCVAGLLCSLLINNLILKRWIARVRPYDRFPQLISLVGPESDYSFPSGHTGAAFSACWVIFKETDKKVGSIALLYAILIALSRLYVGVHYPTDVLAGMVTGIISATLGSQLMKRYYK